MLVNRRNFIKNLSLASLASLSKLNPLFAKPLKYGEPLKLHYLNEQEYRLINRIAKEIIPSEEVLTGRVDIGLNIDSFIFKNPSKNMDMMLKYLKLIALAEPLLPVLRPFIQGIDQDLISFKKMICFLGYYSDANGEAELPPEKRTIWTSIGFDGPKPDDYFPDDSEPRIDKSLLENRLGTL